LPTVAVRIPAHSIPREIARELGRGIVGPSANTSGRPSPTTASHVYDDLAGKVDLILDAGATAIGLESTVVDVTGTYPVVLRQGALTLEEIRSAVGGVSVAASAELLLRSPGTRHRHYAPRARVVCTPAGRKDLLDQKVSEFLLESKRVGVLVATVSGPELEGLIVIDVGATPEEYGRKLFAAFRSMDSAGADVIVVEEPPAGRLGATILERLRRAAEPVPGQA
jgi:L-threonylcarbamoyladenylate synthase